MYCQMFCDAPKDYEQTNHAHSALCLMNTHLVPGIASNASIQQSRTFLAPVISFVEDSSSTDPGQVRLGWGGLGVILAYYIYCTPYFYYYYISSTSDHQTLDPGGWRLLL